MTATNAPAARRRHWAGGQMNAMNTTTALPLRWRSAGAIAPAATGGSLGSPLAPDARQAAR